MIVEAPPRPPPRGFTLLEMVAVLVVVGLLLVFSPMALDSLVPERELDREAGELGGTIETVAAQAVIDRADFAMHYDTEKHRWAVQVPVEVSGTERPRAEDGEETVAKVKVWKLEESVSPEELAWHNLPKGITLRYFEGSRQIATGRIRTLFSWRGTVDPHILVLESKNVSSLNEEERARTIKVNFLGFPTYATGVRTEEMKKTDAEVGR
ncbi:MAG: prepilin-type N-terminal cleavage/methylation domain-containing protein [Planctomycetaceae bacterium]